MSKRTNNERKLIYKGNKKNIFIIFWNWGWNIYYDNPEVWNYIVIGAITTFINLISKFILYFTILDVNKAFDAQIGVIISWIIAVIFAYVSNRIIVFKSKSKKYIKEFISFIGSRLVTYAIEAILTYISFTLLKLTSKPCIIIITLLIQVIIMILNYIFSKLFVFKKGDKNEG